MVALLRFVQSCLKNQVGQGTIEYAWIASLISIVAVLALTQSGAQILIFFTQT